MDIISFIDLSGYEQQRDLPFWTREGGLVLSLHHFDAVPSVSASPASVEARRGIVATHLAAEGGALLESEATSVDGLPAARQLIRIPRRGAPRQEYRGVCVIPRASCSALVKLEAAEDPVTGVREIAVLDEVGPDRFFVPHPHAPALDGGRGYNASDLPEWDARFPEHPLTLIRAELARILPTVRLHAQFRRLPPGPDRSDFDEL